MGIVRRSLLALGALCCLCAASAQPRYENRFVRPLGEALARAEHRFGVRIRTRGFDPDTVALTYADFRIRPWSIEQTLDALAGPLDLKWSLRRPGEYRLEPYEYHRRTPEQGRMMLEWLAARYDDREAWERRRAQLLSDLPPCLKMEPLHRASVAASPVLGECRHFDGYTARNYAIVTLPGLYLCGTAYAPDRPGRHPLVILAAGHWPGGRYGADHQILAASLARMGVVVVDTDIVGWGDSERQVGAAAHLKPYAMQLQLLWSQAALDWACTRDDVDTLRIGAAGGSGGATHALLLALTDRRIGSLAAVAHLAAHFDGGCPCESALPVTLSGGGSCMPELLALLAPREVLVVSDGGDWTAGYPEVEYPYLRRIWGFYNKESAVRNVHFPHGRHLLDAEKRQAVCRFFADLFGLDCSSADETRASVQPDGALRSFPDALPCGAIGSGEELERLIETIK